jgi:hypothetical protein
MYAPLHVQTKGEDGVFRTVEDGEHEGMHKGFWHYDRLCQEQPDKVHMLIRGTRILLRSDTVELADRPVDALL